MFSKKLSRQLKRFIAPDGAEAGLRAWQEKAAADPALPGEIKALAVNLFAFLEAVDETYNHGDDQFRMAVRNLSLSSEELNNVNVAPDRLNITVKAMLESQGEGLLYFDADGICANVYSKICVDFLEGDPAGRHIADVLRLDAEQAQALRSLIRLIFRTQDNVMDFDDLIALAPSRYEHSRGLKIRLRYRPMHDARGDLKGVLLIAADRTGEEEALHAMAAREAEASRILRIARNRNGFVRFLQDVRATFTGIENREAGDVMRAVHTLKGQTAFFWLKNMSEALNDLEHEVQSMQTGGALSPGSLRDICRGYEPRLFQCLESPIKIAGDLWGEAFEADGQVRVIEIARIRHFAARLPDDLAALCLHDIAGLSVRKALRSFETQLHDFAAMTGKTFAPVQYEGKDIQILPEAYAGVFDSLVHVASNIVEHGMESPAMRAQAGKPPEGRVTIHVASVRGGRDFTIEIRDDGAGVDATALRRKLGERAEGMSDDDLLQQVFGLNITTRDRASLMAGRGVGLSAVKAEAEKLGGQAGIRSVPGNGSALILTLPLIWSLEPQGQPGVAQDQIFRNAGR